MRFITLLVISLYLFIPMYLFGHMMHMTDSHMMSSKDCPYLVGEHSICPMDFSEHVSAWQNMLIVMTPISKMLFTFILMSFVYLAISVARYIFYIKRKRHRSVFILYRELFAQGILNGKAY